MRLIRCERCKVRDKTLFAEVPRQDLYQFEASIRVGIYKTRQIIFHEGTPAAGLYVLCHGSVKLYQSDRFGHDHILAIAEPGDVLGELPLDPEEPYSASAEALSESQISYVARECLAELMQMHPSVGMRLIAELSKELGAARRKARDLALKPAENRLAEFLVRLVDDNTESTQNNGAHVTLRYSRREIGELIGVSTETASRLLGRLKNRDLIDACGRDIVILDVERLRVLANYINTSAA